MLFLIISINIIAITWSIEILEERNFLKAEILRVRYEKWYDEMSQVTESKPLVRQRLVLEAN